MSAFSPIFLDIIIYNSCISYKSSESEMYVKLIMGCRSNGRVRFYFSPLLQNQTVFTEVYRIVLLAPQQD